jgi:hypothetical protein
MRELDPSLQCLQFRIPESVYGPCLYLVPKEISNWFTANGLSYPSYTGSNLSGNGFTDGVSNKEYSYSVYNVHPGDAILFKFEFPHIKVRLATQHVDY